MSSRTDMTNNINKTSNKIADGNNDIYPKMERNDDYFLIGNDFSDVKISFKNENDVLLFANKAILSEASPIIKAFLAIESDSVFIIDDDDEQAIITSVDVIDLLKYIYPQFTVELAPYNITGLIHLSEKFLIYTLRSECKQYVEMYLKSFEMTTFNDSKEFIPRHILYKDGTRQHISTEIGTLCAWLREYSDRDEILSQHILNVLKYASTDDLERNDVFQRLEQREKSTIYKTISEFLEQQQYGRPEKLNNINYQYQQTIKTTNNNLLNNSMTNIFQNGNVRAAGDSSMLL